MTQDGTGIHDRIEGGFGTGDKAVEVSVGVGIVRHRRILRGMS